MSSNKERTDKDPVRAGEAASPKRPYATLDLKATEVKATAATEPKSSAAASPAPGSAAAASSPAKGGEAKDSKDMADGGKPAVANAGAKADAKAGSGKDAPTAASKPAEAPKPVPRKPSAVGGFFTHMAAGIVGGFLALLGADTIGPTLNDQLGLPLGTARLDEAAADLKKRVATLETASHKGAGDDELARKVAQNEQRLVQLDELARTVAALGAEQVRIASETKTLTDKLAQPGDAGVDQRVAKLEDQLRAMSAAAESGDPKAGRIQQLASITGRLGDLESTFNTQLQALRKTVGEQIDTRIAPVSEASEAARAGALRMDRDMSQMKTDVARLDQRLEVQKAETERTANTARAAQEETAQLASTLSGLKGDLDSRIKSTAKPADVSAAIAPLAAKIASLEGSVQGVVKSEDVRRSNAERVVLSLELANLKRVVERGQPYKAELGEVKKAAGGRIDLALLARFEDKGVTTVAQLAQEFRAIAGRITDAAGEPADGGIVDRLMAGARSVVRVRKVSHDADDKSTDAVVGRIEAALKEGRLGEAVAQLKSLPAGVSASAQDWLTRAEARQSVDTAISIVEGQLKASLAGVEPPADKAKN